MGLLIKKQTTSVSSAQVPLRHRRKDSDDSFGTESEHSEDDRSEEKDSFKSDEDLKEEEEEDGLFDDDKGVADNIERGEGQEYSM